MDSPSAIKRYYPSSKPKEADLSVHPGVKIFAGLWLLTGLMLYGYMFYSVWPPWKTFRIPPTIVELSQRCSYLWSTEESSSHPDHSQYLTKYYDFALKKCHSDQTEEWSIHGVWPTYNATKWPEYCYQTHLNLTALTPLLDQLKHDWYSCEHGPHHNDENFWAHEWGKHGTCTNFTQFQYFQKGLELYRRVIKNQLVDKFCHNQTVNCLIPFNLNFNQSIFIQ